MGWYAFWLRSVDVVLKVEGEYRGVVIRECYILMCVLEKVLFDFMCMIRRRRWGVGGRLVVVLRCFVLLSI